MDTKTTKKILSADDIVNADDLVGSTIEIDVPEWGGTVLFRPMTGQEAIDFNSQIQSGKRNDAWARIFAQCAVDEAGNRLFPPNKIELLRKKSAKVFFRLQHKLMHLNGMGRGEKTWETLLPILQEAGVEQSVIDLVEAKWQSPEDEAKNE